MTPARTDLALHVSQSVGKPDTVTDARPEDFDDIRTEVRRLCDRYGNEYWRGLEPSTYPTEFVTELTDQGWLGSLIPEAYGGGGLSLAGASVILEEISASGGNPSGMRSTSTISGCRSRPFRRATRTAAEPSLARPPMP